jgi:hypothetical protein
MKKCLMSCGAAKNDAYCVFGHGDPIAVVYYFRDLVRFARAAQELDVFALLHEER